MRGWVLGTRLMHIRLRKVSSLCFLQLFNPRCGLVLKLVLPGGGIILGRRELFLNATLALLLFFKAVLKLGNVSLRLLQA